LYERALRLLCAATHHSTKQTVEHTHVWTPVTKA
jgi:hypothetical protein